MHPFFYRQNKTSFKIRKTKNRIKLEKQEE